MLLVFSCIHPETGKPYVLKDGISINECKEAPANLLKLIVKTGKDGPNIDGAKDDIKINKDNNLLVLEKYQEFLETTPPAVEGGGGDDTTYKVACKGRDLGLSAKKTYHMMKTYFNHRCVPCWSDTELTKKVLNAFEYATGKKGQGLAETDFESVSNKHPLWRGWDFKVGTTIKLKTINNAKNFFLLKDSPLWESLIENTFTNRIYIVKRLPWHPEDIVIPTDGIEWADADTEELMLWLSRTHFFNAGEKLVEVAVSRAAAMKRIHPIRDYLRGLVWDRVPRIETWLIDFCGAKDNLYVRDISRIMLLQPVARILRPGIKADHVIVLEGAQGVGKSTLVEILGGEFYGDFHIDPRQRDTIDAMQGKWIIEMSEMAVIKKSDVESLKSFITTRKDRARLAYGRRSEDFPRQCIFIGTINRDATGEYLNDNTGNRRFMPIEIKRVDFKAIQMIRDQLFAEATNRFLSGEHIHITNKRVIKFAEEEQRKRQASDPWANKVHDYIMERHPGFVTTREIYLYALSGNEASLTIGHQRRIGACLKEIGYEAKVKRVDGGVVRGFFNRKFVRMENEQEAKELFE